MIGLVTAEAKALIAEAEKRRREVREGTPAHAAADGHAEYLDEQQRDAMKRHDARHPESGQFAPASKHPYMTAGHAADSPGNPPATPRTDPAPVLPAPVITPSPEPIVRQVFSADHPERFVHPGFATVSRLGFANPPVPVAPTPNQPAFRTAPFNTGGTL